MFIYILRQPLAPTQKYFNNKECKYMCKELVLYTRYIILQPYTHVLMRMMFFCSIHNSSISVIKFIIDMVRVIKIRFSICNIKTC